MYTTLVDWADRTDRHRRLRQAVRRHPHRDRRGAPRRHAEERDQGGPAGVHRQGSAARRDAAQVPQLGQEAVPADQLALGLHRRRDELPARRRAQGVPVVAQLLRHRDRRRREAGVLQRAAAVRADRSGDRTQPIATQRRDQAPVARQGLPGRQRRRVRADDRHQGRAGPLHRRPHLRRHPAPAQAAHVAHGDGAAGARARDLASASGSRRRSRISTCSIAAIATSSRRSTTRRCGSRRSSACSTIRPTRRRCARGSRRSASGRARSVDIAARARRA